MSYASRSFAIAILALAISGPNANAHGAKTNTEGGEVDTEHIFGFIEGSDTGERGELEGELESTSGIGKGSGRYFATSNALQLKYSFTDDFSVAPMVNFSYHNIRGVPDLSDRNQFAFEGAGAEIRYRFLNWRTAPFGLTISAHPTWARRDEATGEPVEQFGLELAVLLDKELVKDRVFAAFNLFYEPSWTHVTATATSEQNATFGFGGAVTTQIMSGIFVGGELLYLRAYERAGLNNFAGHALFLGPTAYLALSKRANLTIAWITQITGKAVGDPNSPDLTNFERNQVRVRFGMSF